ncbi:hypothetical protein AYO20_08289 [Fonsecaea nubica]|uniref:Major facilitator superfamily (MFS) profile domain-containing protein n=1 Tax=Fonsecaea nubica TaxID=856822 RepID=A0A178CPL2_9EURO|nr:hypothetical protein AYO20_08289 [Fonsecaea nubica]OAL31234.1 hypothetical protein AYO20_08289 [Fonsecaea nubica]
MQIKIPALLRGRRERQTATDANGQSANDSDHKATMDSKHESIALENGVQHFESATDTSDAQGRVTGRVILAIAALGLTYEAALFSFVVPAAVLLTINADIGPSANLSWVATSLSLANAVLQATFGRGADIFGRRYFLICGNIFGLVGTLVNGRANSIRVVIAGTAIQGIGAALQQVAYVSAFDIVPKKHREATLSALNLAALPASMFGAIIAFSVVKTLSWRYTYYFGTMINGIALIMVIVFYWPPGWVGLRPDGKSRTQQLKDLDYVGVLLMAGGLTVATLLPLWEFYAPADMDRLFPGKLITNVRSVILPLFITFASGLAVALWAPGLLASMSAPNSSRPSHSDMQIVIQTLFTTDPDRAGWLSFVLNAAGTTGIMTSGIFFGILRRTRLQLVAYTALQTVFPAAMSTITQHSLARAVVLAIFTGWALSSTMIVSVLFVQYGVGDDRLGISNGLRGTIVNSGAAIGFAIYRRIVNNKVKDTMGPAMATALVGAGLPANSVEPFIGAFLTGNSTVLAGIDGVTPTVLAAATSASRDVYTQAFRILFLVTTAFTGAAFIGSLFVPSVDIHLTQDTAIQLDKPHVIGHGEGEAKVLTEESA